MQLTQTLTLALMAAVPLVQGLPSFASNTEYVSHGVFEHNGIEFELQSREASHSREEAFQHFLNSSQPAQENVHEARRIPYDTHRYPKYPWFNCTAEGTFVGGCNNWGWRGPKKFYKQAGYYATKHSLAEMMTEAFQDGRGNRAPFHICRTSNGLGEDGTLCLSWHMPMKAALQPHQQTAMVEFAMSCVGPRGLLSSNMRAGFDEDINAKPPPEYTMVCVTNEVSKCEPVTDLCNHIFLKDDSWSRGKTHLVEDDALWNTHNHEQDMGLVGPCVLNCDDM